MDSESQTIMSPVILKHEFPDEDINIEYKPPADILNIISETEAPAHRTVIVTKNEITDDLGMDIQIDSEMTLNDLSDRMLQKNVSEKTSSSRRTKTSTGHSKVHEASDNSIKPFSCDFCQKTFARKQYLSTHRLMHTREKTIQCNECPKKFIRQSCLKKHFRGTHFKPFACVKCQMKFRTESVLAKHTKTHEPFWTKTRTYECYLCKTTRHYWKIGNLRDHMRSRHTSERPYRCEQCPKTFAVRSCLTAHKASHSQRERIHECNVCHKTFYTKPILTSHMKSHYDKPFQCEKCTKSFLRKGDLSRHCRTNSCKRMTHLPKVSIFQCYICSKELKSFYLLRRHMLLFHLRNHSKRYSCDECPKKYTSMEHLRYHKRAIHRNERPFACSLCSKTFHDKAYLAKHCLIHSKEKPFVCEICSKAFSHKSNLTRHKVCHVGERKFECDVCFKKFMFQAILNTHKLTHVAIEFSCSECPKVFISRHGLTRHVKFKHNEPHLKPFKCELCEKSFKENTTLKSHFRAVHLQLKPFECVRCKWKFSSSGNFIAHERICKGLIVKFVSRNLNRKND